MWKDNENIIEIYNKVNEGNLTFPCECPNCKKESVHLYLHEYKDKRCGLWIWCSKCGAFAHMSSYAPNWWKNPNFINENKLYAEPTYLESKAMDIDEWVNSIVPSKRNNTQETFIEDRFNVKLKIDVQGIPAGTKGVLVIKNNLEYIIIQFIYNGGITVDFLLSQEELLNVVEIL